MVRQGLRTACTEWHLGQKLGRVLAGPHYPDIKQKESDDLGALRIQNGVRSESREFPEEPKSCLTSREAGAGRQGQTRTLEVADL